MNALEFGLQKVLVAWELSNTTQILLGDPPNNL